MIARRAVVLLVMGTVGASTARADLTPLSSSLSLTAYANVVYGSPQTSTETKSQGATTHPLSVSVEAESGFYYTLGVSGSASATWTDPAHAEIQFTNLGWSGYEANGDAELYQSTGWTYTFRAGTPGPLAIDYNITESGWTAVGPTPFLGLNDFFVYFGAGTTQPSNPIAETRNSLSGEIDLNIAAPGIYTAQILPYSNLAGGIGTTDVHLDGTFHFSAGPKTIAAPELSSTTMVLSISGLAAFAFKLRRAHPAARR